MDKIIGGIIATVIIGLLVATFYSAMNREEVFECTRLQSQASEYSGFYLAHWQDEQCRAHGFNINAPVK